MDEGKGSGLKRVSAWIGVILFILLVINIFTVQFQLEVSIGIYVFLIIIYIFFLRKQGGPEDRDDGSADSSESPDND